MGIVREKWQTLYFETSEFKVKRLVRFDRKLAQDDRATYFIQLIQSFTNMTISLNERATDLKFFTAGDNVEEYQRRLFADQLRFEQYQATLFAWMNGENGNRDDLNIDNLRE